MARRIFILLICSLLLSCTKEEKAEPTYTLTVVAGKEGTKALSLESGSLKATWAEGEEVKVYKTGTLNCLGTLSAQSSGKSTTLSGTITGDIKVEDYLTLDFPNGAYDYTNQDGTLTGNSTSIDKVCDYATATVQVTSVEGGTVTTEAATFTNEQAIVRFRLKLNEIDFPADEMSVTVSGYISDGPSSRTISVKPKTSTYELYVAIPCFYNDESHPLTLSFDVVAIGNHHTKSASMKLKNGGFYKATVSLQ